jgi:hypothetical protein
MKRLAVAALALAAVLAGTSTALAAANKLTNPAVSPTSGSTTDTFAFSVDYTGGAPTSVWAVAGSLTVTLSLCSGTKLAGTWCKSRTLPAGTWPFIFHATAAGHPANVTASVTVTVTVIGPTPRPTPIPPPTATQRATPTPTPVATASPHASASSTGTAVASVSPGPLGSSPSAGASSSSPGGGLGGGDVDQQLGRILTGGLVAIGLLAVVGFAAIWRDRRRREEEGLVLAPAPSAAPMPATEPRPTAAWERDFGLEDEPIGTIEYQPPGDEGKP